MRPRPGCLVGDGRSRGCWSWSSPLPSARLSFEPSWCGIARRWRPGRCSSERSTTRSSCWGEAPRIVSIRHRRASVLASRRQRSTKHGCSGPATASTTGQSQHQADPGHAGLVVTAGPPTAWITWPAGVAVPGHQRALPGTWVCSPWTVDAAFRPRWVRRILDVRRWFGSCGWRGADHTRRKRGAASCVTSLEGAFVTGHSARYSAAGAGQAGLRWTVVVREGPPVASATGTWRARPARTKLGRRYSDWHQLVQRARLIHDDHLPRWQAAEGSAAGQGMPMWLQPDGLAPMGTGDDCSKPTRGAARPNTGPR